MRWKPLFYIFALLISFCNLSDEENLNSILEILAKACLKKDIKTIEKYVSKDYHDLKGNDYKGLRFLLTDYFLKQPKISIIITEQKIDLKKEIATVEIHAILSYEKEIKSFYVFIIDFKKIDGKWLILSADWFKSDERRKNYKSIHELQMEEH